MSFMDLIIKGTIDNNEPNIRRNVNNIDNQKPTNLSYGDEIYPIVNTNLARTYSICIDTVPIGFLIPLINEKTMVCYMYSLLLPLDLIH